MTDREALTLALQKCRAESPERDRQIDDMLIDRPWQEVCEFASYSCQMTHLKLRPWQCPPCWVEPDDRKHPQAAKLLREMTALGISRFHPDPLAAIAAAKA